MSLPKFWLLLLCCCLPLFALAQADPSRAVEDTSDVPGPDRLAFENPNGFDFIIQRGVFLTQPEGDYAPLRTLSGNWFLGFAFNFPLANNLVGFRVSPGVTWVKLNYNVEDENFDFTPQTTLTELPENNLQVQRHRLTYLELPVGFFANLTRDEENKRGAFIEAGGFVGYQIAGALKQNIEEAQGQQLKLKVSSIPDAEALRYGVYGRIGYKNVALSFNYRLTELFENEGTEEGTVTGSDGQPTSLLYPAFPTAQIALTLML